MSSKLPVSNPNSGSNAEPEVSFEKSLAELEGIVAQLEAGAKPLDESLALYEEGVAAYRRCNSILEKARSRIRLVLANANGEPTFREAESAKPQAQPSQSGATAKTSRRASPASAEKKPDETALPPELQDPPPETESSSQPDAGSEEPAKNEKQYLDSDPSSPQNVSPLSRPRVNTGKPKAGDSLFGSSK